MYPLNHIYLNIRAREEDGLGAVVEGDIEVVGTKGEGYIPHTIYIIWDSANSF